MINKVCDTKTKTAGDSRVTQMEHTDESGPSCGEAYMPFD